jgi:hypothetical protein
MGTITDKLNWLYEKKKKIIDLYNERMYSTNKSNRYNYLDSNFATLNSDYMSNFRHRMRLVPVLTLYMSYNYIPSTSNYMSRITSTRSETWLKNIISNSSAYTYNGNVPTMSRSDTGVITTTNNVVHSASVLNIPFIIGCGPTENDTSQSTWMTKPLYGDISYYYNQTTSSGAMKIILADDSSANDGHFILGNISLIDPLLQDTDMFKYTMYCIDVYYGATVNIFSGTNLDGSYTDSSLGITHGIVQNGTGNFTITYYGIGSNTFNRFNVIPLNCLSSSSGASSNGKSYVTIKSIVVNLTSIVVTVLTSDDENLNNAPVGLMLFAQKY